MYSIQVQSAASFRGERIMETGSQGSNTWRLFGHALPRTVVVYLTQSLLIYIVVITSLVNLTIGVEYHNVWIGLMSSCLGYLLPSPRIKKAIVVPTLES